MKTIGIIVVFLIDIIDILFHIIASVYIATFLHNLIQPHNHLFIFGTIIVFLISQYFLFNLRKKYILNQNNGKAKLYNGKAKLCFKLQMFIFFLCLMCILTVYPPKPYIIFM